MFIVYKTTNLVNQKIYVGQHNTSADDGYLGSGLLLERAIEKYGVENFKRSTIEFCTSSNIDERETYWIEELDARNSQIGYNIAQGGSGGFTRDWNEEERKQISERMKDYVNNLSEEEFNKRMEKLNIGFDNYIKIDENRKKLSINASLRKRQKHSKETKQKMSDNSWIKGKKHKEESIIKMKETIKNKGGRKGNKNGMFKKHHSNETKEILSQKRKEYFLNNIEDISKYKYILKKDGEKFEFFNLKTFCKNNKGFNISGIIGAIRNNRKYKGWKILKILR